ncbi:MAG: AIR synthase family protein [Nitrososphaeria archaeon]|jgi:hydrogenase maturation factor
MKAFGKINEKDLRKYVLPNLGVKDENLVEPADVGVDFAVLQGTNQYIIVSSDPVTGVRKNIGLYAVNVNANDVATSGNRPRFMVNVILLAKTENASSLAEITKEIDRACKILGISVIGGHTETTKGIKQTILVMTALTFASSYVSSKRAKEGDVILMSKTAGLEGTSILAHEYRKSLSRLGEKTIENALKMVGQISIVNEAEAAFKTGYVHAMHDPTEGGVLGGVYEMSVASKLGFIIDKNLIPVAQETKKISKALQIDPLKLISSGVLLLAVDPKGKEYVIEALKDKGVEVNEIGNFMIGERSLLSNGRRLLVKESPIDELWRIKRKDL